MLSPVASAHFLLPQEIPPNTIKINLPQTLDVLEE
jgi:hypothetical protein